MFVRATELNLKHAYQLMVSAIVPRPIAWVGTRSQAGEDNLAPFSYFMGVGSAPPTLAISVARHPDGSLKDTAQNIQSTGVFTVSIAHAAHGPEVVGSAARLPPEVSEFEAMGLTLCQGELVDAPRPAVAPVSMECRLFNHMDVGHTTLFVGEVLAFYLADAVVREGRDGNPTVDLAALKPLGRLGGRDYVVVDATTHVVPKSPQ